MYQLVDLGSHNEPVYIALPEQPCSQTPRQVNGTTEFTCRDWTDEPEEVGNTTVGFTEPSGNASTMVPFIDINWTGPKPLALNQGETSAVAVNFGGAAIVGWAYSQVPEVLSGANFATIALLWQNSQAMPIELPSLVPGDASYSASATATNDAGEVVGFSNIESGDNRAVVWEPCGASPNGSGYCAIELDQALSPGSPQVNLAMATGIDCQGDIAAYGGPGYSTLGAQEVTHDYLLVRVGGNGGATCPQT